MSRRATQYNHKDMLLKGLYRTVSLSDVEERPATKNGADDDDRRQKMAAVGKEEKAVGSKGSSRAGSFLSRCSTFHSGKGYEPEKLNNWIPIRTDRVAIRRKFDVDRLSLPHIEGVTNGAWQFDPKMMRRTPGKGFKDRLRRILQSYLVWATVFAVAIFSLILFVLLQSGSLERHRSKVYVIQILLHSVFVFEMLVRLYADGLSYFSVWHDVLDSFVVAVAFSLIFVTETGAVVSSARLLIFIWREEQRKRGSGGMRTLMSTGTTTNGKRLCNTRRRSEGGDDRDMVDFETPAVQLYKLVSRTVSSSCNVYSVTEKKQLRNLMYMLSHNQIYVDTDVKRGNAAYWKEYGFQKHTRRHVSAVGSGTMSTLQMNSIACPQSRSTRLAGSGFMSFSSLTPAQSINSTTSGVGGLGLTTISRCNDAAANLDLPHNVIKEDVLLTYLSKVDEWDFDAFYLDEISGGHSLASLCTFLFDEMRHNFFEHFDFSVPHFRNFILQIEAGYGAGEGKGANNVYHNRRHAADVTQAVHYFITTCGLGASLTDIEMVSLLLGAIVHDFKHPGRSNAFLMNSCNELSLLYNDISVLENYHASEAFRVLRQDECNFLRNVDPAAIGSIRHLAIQILLATDLKFHFDILGEFNLHLSDIQNEIREEGKARTYLSAMKMCIKSADMCHPARPMYIHLRWTKCLMEEFFLQGDEEKNIGIEVSPNCDRNDLDIADSQKSFINFLVKPLFKSWVSFLHSPNADVCMTSLSLNEAMWSSSKKYSTKGKTLNQLTSMHSGRSRTCSLRSSDWAIDTVIPSPICNTSSTVECDSHDYTMNGGEMTDETFNSPPSNNNNNGVKDIEIGYSTNNSLNINNMPYPLSPEVPS